MENIYSFMEEMEVFMSNSISTGWIVSIGIHFFPSECDEEAWKEIK